MNDNKVLGLRITLVYALVLLFGAAIAVKLFTIQLAEGDKWRAKAVNVATASWWACCARCCPLPWRR